MHDCLKVIDFQWTIACLSSFPVFSCPLCFFNRGGSVVLEAFIYRGGGVVEKFALSLDFHCA